MNDLSRKLAPLAVIIMGVSGCGKSTLGPDLADAIGCPYLEGDRFHAPEAVAKMRSGVPLSSEDRWPWLDRLGDAIDASVARNGVAVAACSALTHAYRDRLRDRIAAPVWFVLLAVERAELERRFAHRTGHYMPASLLGSQLQTLEVPGPDETALTLDATRPPALLRDDVVNWLTRSAVPARQRRGG